MQITIIGTGYVGLVTGTCFAQMGHTVLCLDVDCEKIQSLKKGIVPIFEPGLDALIHHDCAEKRLFFTTDYAKAIAFGAICFLALPTPSAEDGSCDTTYLEEAARQIGEHLTHPQLTVNKSTAPVGTAHRLQALIVSTLQARGLTLTVEVASNPEFLKEGSAIEDCLHPDRIVIGSASKQAAEQLKELYTPFVTHGERILLMDVLSAEMTKYAANAMLATRISFMNEIASICKHVGANIQEVRRGMSLDTRIGPHFLAAGVGYGGSCFPKDVRALIALAKQVGCTPYVLQSVDHVNDEQKKLLSKKILHYFAARGGIKNKTIAVWGLSFKPKTDDMREAPSLIFIRELLLQGASLRLFDPIAMSNAKQHLEEDPNITWCQSEAEAAQGADAIALLTEWEQFRHLDFHPIKQRMRGSAFFDGRNHYHPLAMKQQGFDYIGIGVPDQLHSMLP